MSAQEIYQHAYSYTSLSRGFDACTPAEEAYYQEHVRHIEALEEAYAQGFFDARASFAE